MRLLGVFGEITKLRREFRDLTDESVAEEEKAKYELTASARKFSRRAKNLVDDKMTFSATLMRAGEVDAANRLLEEVEQDVRVEEAALVEKMNEVKVARASRRERLTRVRLARLMAISLVGSMLMGFSALGMAAAGFMQERENDQIRQNAVAMRRAAQANGALAASGKVSRQLKGNLKGLNKGAAALLMAQVSNGDLTPRQAANIRTLAASGDVDAIEDLLSNVLPSGVARELVTKITDSVNDVVVAAPEAAAAPEPALAAPKVKKKIRKTAEEAESSEPEPSPSPDETDAPEETEEKGDKQETDGGDDGQEASGPGDDDGVFGDDEGEGLSDQF
jgi:hypothetical protein